MDGGYVENFGADTTRDIVADIDVWRDVHNPGGSKTFEPHVLVIQISSDPAVSLAEIPRCGRPVPEVLKLSSINRPFQALSDVFGPLITVIDARGARGARTAGDLMRRKCPTVDAGYVEYVHLALCNETIEGRKADDVLGLNWALTTFATRFLSDAPPKETLRVAAGEKAQPRHEGTAGPSAMQSCANEAQISQLVAWFDKPWLKSRKSSDADKH
jgi:hypothetical protein